MNQNTKYVDPWRTDEDLAMKPVPIGGARVLVTHTKAHRRITPWTLHRQVGPAWDGGSCMSGTKGVSLLDGNNSLPGGPCLSLSPPPLSPPNRPITSINSHCPSHASSSSTTSPPSPRFLCMLHRRRPTPWTPRGSERQASRRQAPLLAPRRR